MSVTPPAVSFVVPTFRRPEILERTLAGLAGVDYPAELMEVLVVPDDEHDHRSAMVLERAREQATCEIIGVVRRKAGASADDMIVATDHVRRHLHTRERFGDCVLNGARKFAPETIAELSRTPFGPFRIGLERGYKQAVRMTDLGAGCFAAERLPSYDLSIRRTSFWRLGGFDEDIPFGWEDQEFSLRAEQAGMPLIHDDTIRSLHHDWCTTLRMFCVRQEHGAQGFVAFAHKYPTRFETHPLLVENGPRSRRDPFRRAFHGRSP